MVVVAVVGVGVGGGGGKDYSLPEVRGFQVNCVGRCVVFCQVSFLFHHLVFKPVAVYSIDFSPSDKTNMKRQRTG